MLSVAAVMVEIVVDAAVVVAMEAAAKHAAGVVAVAAELKPVAAVAVALRSKEAALHKAVLREAAKCVQVLIAAALRRDHRGDRRLPFQAIVRRTVRTLRVPCHALRPAILWIKTETLHETDESLQGRQRIASMLLARTSRIWHVIETLIATDTLPDIAATATTSIAMRRIAIKTVTGIAMISIETLTVTTGIAIAMEIEINSRGVTITTTGEGIRTSSDRLRHLDAIWDILGGMAAGEIASHSIQVMDTDMVDLVPVVPVTTRTNPTTRMLQVAITITTAM